MNRDPLGALLSFALKVNADASSMNPGDITGVLNAGWSEQTVEDVVALVAIQKLYNTIASGLGFKALPAEICEQIGREPAEKGGYVESFRAYIQVAGK